MNSSKSARRGRIIWHAIVVGGLFFVADAWNAHVAHATEGGAIANIVLKHLHFVDGDVENIGASKACIALRGKVNVERKTLRSSTDWQEVERTSQYSAVNQTRARLQKAGCSATGQPSSACRDLRSKLEQEADALAKTVQWDALARSDDWRSLRESYAKAERAECVNAPTPHLQTPDEVR